MNDFKRKLTPTQVLVTFVLVLLPVVLIFCFVWNGYKLEDFTVFQKVAALIAIVFIYFTGNHFLERGVEKLPINWFKNPVAASEYGVSTKKRYLTRIVEYCLMFLIIWLTLDTANLKQPLMKGMFIFVLFLYLVLFPSIYSYALYKRIQQQK